MLSTQQDDFTDHIFWYVCSFMLILIVDSCFHFEIYESVVEIWIYLFDNFSIIIKAHELETFCNKRWVDWTTRNDSESICFIRVSSYISKRPFVAEQFSCSTFFPQRSSKNEIMLDSCCSNWSELFIVIVFIQKKNLYELFQWQNWKTLFISMKFKLASAFEIVHQLHNSLSFFCWEVIWIDVEIK